MTRGTLSLLPAVFVFTSLSAHAQEESLDERIAKVLPRKGTEKWNQIPWRLDLLAAREEAERTGKPLFLWLMDGHPLGCT